MRFVVSFSFFLFSVDSVANRHHQSATQHFSYQIVDTWRFNKLNCYFHTIYCMLSFGSERNSLDLEHLSSNCHANNSRRISCSTFTVTINSIANLGIFIKWPLNNRNVIETNFCHFTSVENIFHFNYTWLCCHWYHLSLRLCGSCFGLVLTVVSLLLFRFSLLVFSAEHWTVNTFLIWCSQH